MLRESLDWFLEKISGIKVNRLPSECFARYMLVEACTVSDCIWDGG